MLTERQKKFCDIYLACGNVTQAVAEAGYSLKSGNNKYRLLHHPDVINYLARKGQLPSNESIASADEVLAFLSAVMRGQVTDYRVSSRSGKVSVVPRPATVRERITAASMLGKRYALFAERISIEDASRVVFSEIDIPE